MEAGDTPKGERQWEGTLCDWYNEMGRVLMRIAKSNGVSEHDAQDVCQETLKKAAEFTRSFTTPGRFESKSWCKTWDGRVVPDPSWMIRVAANAAIDKRRKDQRKAGHVERYGYLQAQKPMNIRSPEARAEMNERDRLVKECLEGLPSDQHQAITLHHVFGCMYERIAEAMNIVTGDVKALLQRARRALKNCVLWKWGDSDGDRSTK